MKPVILVPWRGDGSAERERNLRFVLDWYSALGWEIWFGDDGSQPFSRGGSRNAAARNAGDWDVALIADADCVARIEVVMQAVSVALGGPVVLPHDDFYDLREKASARIASDPKVLRRAREERYYIRRLAGPRYGEPHRAPSGAIVISRESWDKMGGYDSRFIGWGYEDTAFLYAAINLGLGVERLPGPLLHIWHRRDKAMTLPAVAESNVSLARRYREAYTPDAMASLIAERA